MLRTVKSLFWISFRSELFNAPQMLSQSVFFVLILVVFNFLWTQGAQSGLPMPASAREMLWYLVLTEVVTLSLAAVHRDIESDLQKGRMAAALLRPTHYLSVVCWQGAGTLFARIPVFGLVGAVTALALTGGWPDRGVESLLALLLAPLACGVLLILVTSVGLSAVWLRECSPLYWVFQKSLFVFGGLMLPLSMYPDWFQSLAAVLPFKPVLYGVAQAILGAPISVLLWNAVSLVIWFVAGLALAHWLHGRFVRKVLRGEI
jgi:ABC-2 type transport system permease protein